MTKKFARARHALTHRRFQVTIAGIVVIWGLPSMIMLFAEERYGWDGEGAIDIYLACFLLVQAWVYGVVANAATRGRDKFGLAFAMLVVAGVFSFVPHFLLRDSATTPTGVQLGTFLGAAAVVYLLDALVTSSRMAAWIEGDDARRVSRLAGSRALQSSMAQDHKGATEAE